MAASWINVITLPGFSFTTDFGTVSQVGSGFDVTGFEQYDSVGNNTGARIAISSTGAPTGKVLTGATRVNVTAAVGVTYDLLVDIGGGISTHLVSSVPFTVTGAGLSNVYVAEEIPNGTPTSVTFSYEVEIDDAPPPSEFWTDFRGCEEQS